MATGAQLTAGSVGHAVPVPAAMLELAGHAACK